jgi:hypothetical protein
MNPIARYYRLTLSALVAGCVIFHLAILWESRKDMAAGYGDFIILYTGAQIVNDGKSTELFQTETQNAYQAKFAVPKLEWPLPFNHAPYELLLFLPLARLPYPIAHAIWSSMNLMFLIIMLQWLLTYVKSPHSFFIVASVLGWFPTMETLRLGQDSILSTMLLLAVFVALKRKRDAWAGLFLALGLYKPQLVLPMAGALLVARRWKSLSVFIITGVILVAVSLGMVGRQGAFDLISILRQMDNYSFVIHPALMPNVRGFTYVLLQAENLEFLTGAITFVISAALYAFCLYLWRQEMDVLDPRFDLNFALTIVATVLISYHLYAHDLFPVALSLILFFRYLIAGTSTSRLISNAFFILLIVFFLPIVPRYLIQTSGLGWGAVPILFLYVVLCMEICNRDGNRNVGVSKSETGPFTTQNQPVL